MTKCSENDLSDKLKTASDYGWELVSAERVQGRHGSDHIFGSTPWYLFFKRPKAEKAKAAEVPPTISEPAAPPPSDYA